jgi:hypothetical protein
VNSCRGIIQRLYVEDFVVAGAKRASIGRCGSRVSADLIIVLVTMFLLSSSEGLGASSHSLSVSSVGRPDTTAVSLARPVSEPDPQPSTTTVILNDTGVGPTAASIEANESGLLCGSTSWTLQVSTNSSSGPWSIWSTFYGNYNSVTWYTDGFMPRSTHYWQAILDDYCSGYLQSNILQVVQPTNATLSYTLLTSTTIGFSWNNNAVYGGVLSFVSYQLEQKINGTNWSVVSSVISVSSRFYNLDGLAYGTVYTFRLVTTDDYCDTCSPSSNYLASTTSNVVTIEIVEPLSAIATASQPAADEGQTTDFFCVAAGGVGAYSYAWTFGDGSSGSGQAVGHQYSTSGAMTVTCTVMDSNKSGAIGEVEVNIDPAPTVKVTVDHDAVGPGTRVDFTAAPAGGPGRYTSYHWAFGDGTSGSGLSVGHAFASAGAFTATVVVTDSNNGTATGTAVVTVSSISITAVASSRTAPTGQSISFTAAATGGGGPPFTYTWTFGDGASSSGASANHTFSVAGSYVTTVSVNDSSGGSNRTSLPMISVTDAPTSSPFGPIGGAVGVGILSTVVAAAVAVAVLLSRRGKNRA